MVPADVAWEACIFVNSILKVEISLDPEGYSSSWHFSFTIILVEGVWDILDTWWWSLSPIILSFDVFVEFPNARLCMKSISCTNLGPLREWYSRRYEQYFCQSLGATEAILWPPRWLDSPGGWGGAALEVFDRPVLLAVGQWDCFRRFPWSSLQWRRVFCLRLPLWKD